MCPVDNALYGETRAMPLDDERGWGAQVRGVLIDSMDGLDSISRLQDSGVAFLKLESTDSTLAASATLTPTHPIHRVAGSGGAVTLSATTAIADGTIADQVLVLQGTSDTNTVTVPDGANTALNGLAILSDGTSLLLIWDATNSKWRELSRNN